MRLHVYHLCQRSRVYSTGLQLTLLTNQDMTHIQLWRYYVYVYNSIYSSLWEGINCIYQYLPCLCIGIKNLRFLFIDFSVHRLFLSVRYSVSWRYLHDNSRRINVLHCPCFSIYLPCDLFCHCNFRFTWVGPCIYRRYNILYILPMRST